MIVTYDYKPGTPLTPEQIERIRDAAKRDIVFDEDSPELTPETYAAFQQAAHERNQRLKNQSRTMQ